MFRTKILGALMVMMICVNGVLAQNNMASVTGYAGISPIPHEMKQGNIAFNMPMPKSIKIRKGIAGKRSVKKYLNLIPFEKEGYYLKISKYEIILAGRDETGLYYAEKTLNKILSKGGSISETEILDWPDVEYRGVIEGFYGNPWSHQDRLSQFAFYGDNKMNTYVYGPKDDPYHRKEWRTPYPKKEAEMMKELTKEAKKNHVQFVWAIHPGQDIHWNKEDNTAIVKKFESMYDLGVRSFAVFFDDISGEGTQAEKQAELMNYLTDNFVRKHKDVKPLTLCPTQYCKGMSSGNYLRTLGNRMYPEVRIMWTGEGVVDMIDRDDLAWVNSQINRKAFIWLNYPVNDYCQSRLLMGKTYGNAKDIADLLGGFCSNPMEYAEASKVSLYGIADYTWNMAEYDAQKNWERSMDVLMKGTSEAFRVFCENNVDLGQTGFGLRREGESLKYQKYLEKLDLITQEIMIQDSMAEAAAKEAERVNDIINKNKRNSASKRVSVSPEEFARQLRLDRVKRGYEAVEKIAKNVEIDSLREQLNEIIWASNTLLNDSVNHPAMYNEIKPWVLAMYYSAVRGIDLCEEVQSLLKKDNDNFVLIYSNYKRYTELQNAIVSRDFEGSIVKAKPVFSGEVITPLLNKLNALLIKLYKVQYREHLEVFED